MTPTYLDHAASTPVLPEVEEAVRAATAEAFGNPSSAHAVGRKARQRLEEARERLAAALGATPEEVIFTSGATEANNLAVFGSVMASRDRQGAVLPSPPLSKGGPGGVADKNFTPPGPPLGKGGENQTTDARRGHLLTSAIEHPCVTEPVKQLAASGYAVDWLPVTPQGVIEQRSVLDRVRPDTRLVALMLANHETGAIQPVRHVAKTLPKGVHLHCDAAQAVGKLPVNFRDLGVSSLSLSGHKLGGPKGVGALLLKAGVRLRPQAFGGHQQRGHRPGTEPVPLAVGLAVAVELAVANLERNTGLLNALKDTFIQCLKAHRQPSVGLTLNSPAESVPSILNVSFPGCRSELLLMALDLAGVACSTGSACSSGSLLPSPVLEAMGVPDAVLRSAMRFSFSPTQTVEEVATAADRVAECVLRVRTQAG